MENAVDALKIAFAVMVFTIALSVAMATFSQARETSEAVLYMNDKTNYYVYDEIVEGETVPIDGTTSYTTYTSVSTGITYTDKRIVGIEAIIPTLYRYYKENYTVIFEGIDKPIYYLESGKWKNSYTTGGEEVFEFDLNSEISRKCPWVGTVNDIKLNLDYFLNGDIDKDFGNINRKVSYNRFEGSKGFIDAYSNSVFLEQLGEYATDRNYGIETDTEGRKWLVISSGSDAGKYRYNPETGKINPNVNAEDIADLNIQCTIKVSDFLKDKDKIYNNATTYYDEAETNGEIIELAKPTIKRVIKYTLINNP